MGCGKTAVGMRLSEVLTMPFLDLDAEIEKDTNLSVKDIFAAKGEIYFRKKEREILATLLAQKNNFVLATGGGAPCYGTTLELLKNTPNTVVCYLNASVPILTERLFPERHKRPLIAHLDTPDTLEDFIRKHLFERAYYYQQADVKIDANETVETIVASIVLRLF